MALLLAAIACAWSAARAAAADNDWHCQVGKAIGSPTPSLESYAVAPADNNPAHFKDIGDRLRADVCYRKAMTQSDGKSWIYNLRAAGEASNVRQFPVVASVRATLSAFLDGKRVMFSNQRAVSGPEVRAPDGRRTSIDLTGDATADVSVPRKGTHTVELFANATAVFKHWLLRAPDIPANSITWNTAGLGGIGTAKGILKTS